MHPKCLVLPTGEHDRSTFLLLLRQVKEVVLSMGFIGKAEGVATLMSDRICRYVNSQSAEQCCDSSRFFI